MRTIKFRGLTEENKWVMGIIHADSNLLESQNDSN